MAPGLWSGLPRLSFPPPGTVEAEALGRGNLRRAAGLAPHQRCWGPGCGLGASGRERKRCGPVSIPAAHRVPVGALRPGESAALPGGGLNAAGPRVPGCAVRVHRCGAGAHAERRDRAGPGAGGEPGPRRQAALRAG